LILSALRRLLELFYLGIFESAIGLEMARVTIFWYLIWQRDRSDFRTTFWRALRTNLLYVFLAAGFLIWRVFIFQSTRRATNLDVLFGRYGNMPVRSLMQVG